MVLGPVIRNRPIRLIDSVIGVGGSYRGAHRGVAVGDAADIIERAARAAGAAVKGSRARPGQRGGTHLAEDGAQAAVGPAEHLRPAPRFWSRLCRSSFQASPNPALVNNRWWRPPSQVSSKSAAWHPDARKCWRAPAFVISPRSGDDQRARGGRILNVTVYTGDSFSFEVVVSYDPSVDV